MKSLANRFVREEEGQDLIEYGLLIGIITVGCILAIKSIRPSVTSKKNFKPVIVALSVIGEVPRSTMSSWKRRRSSMVALSGERFRKTVSWRTART